MTNPNRCHCGRVFLQRSWAATTEAPTWSQHTRQGCYNRRRPHNATDEDWQSVLAARGQEAPLADQEAA